MSNILQSSGCANLRDQSKKYMSVEKEESSGETKSLTSTWLKSYRKSQKEKKKKRQQKKKKENIERKNCICRKQNLGTKKPWSYQKGVVGLLLKWRKGNR